MGTSRVAGPIVAEAVTKIYEAALPAESLAKIVAFAISQPDDVDVNEIVFRADVAKAKSSPGGRRDSGSSRHHPSVSDIHKSASVQEF